MTKEFWANLQNNDVSDTNRVRAQGSLQNLHILDTPTPES